MHDVSDVWTPPFLAKSCILGCQAHWSTKKVDVKKAVLGSFGVYCETQALCEVSKYKFNPQKITYSCQT